MSSITEKANGLFIGEQPGPYDDALLVIACPYCSKHHKVYLNQTFNCFQNEMRVTYSKKDK